MNDSILEHGWYICLDSDRHVAARPQLFFVVFASCVIEEQSSIRKGLPRRAVEEIRTSIAKQLYRHAAKGEVIRVHLLRSAFAFMLWTDVGFSSISDACSSRI